MKEKIKKILTPNFLIILLTIILVFSLTTYWRNETKNSIEEWKAKNEIEEETKMPLEKFNAMVKYQTYRWEITYRKIWTYDLLILASGILLFVALRRKNDQGREN